MALLSLKTDDDDDDGDGDDDDNDGGDDDDGQGWIYWGGAGGVHPPTPGQRGYRRGCYFS